MGEKARLGDCTSHGGTVMEGHEHVMGNNMCPYLSTSSIFPGGSPRFDGREIYIDVEKAYFGADWVADHIDRN